jgi:protein arginine N-methyltransferase 3
MGYALLYESMLDSVLVARDRFLRPGGVMAPSQCKMMFGLTDAREIFKERIGFWSDIYGMSVPSVDAHTSLMAILQALTSQQWPLKSTMTP